MTTPNDCIIVALKVPGTGTHCETWRIAGDENKTIPIDIYNQISEKLVVIDDPHGLLPKEESVEKPVKKRGGKAGKK